MSPNQKRFKIVSLVIMLVALVQVVGGVLLLLGSPLVAGLRIDLGGDASYDGVIAAEVLGVLALVVGLYCFAVGVTGARAANSPRSIGKFNVLAVVRRARLGRGPSRRARGARPRIRRQGAQRGYRPLGEQRHESPPPATASNRRGRLFVRRRSAVSRPCRPTL